MKRIFFSLQKEDGGSSEANRFATNISWLITLAALLVLLTFVFVRSGVCDTIIALAIMIQIASYFIARWYYKKRNRM
ncbi:MAG: hypothetical protein VB035_14570 [Candidatus Fimivivens sp.]|nr:hypothetical protein [Candidatus Fimivivens sp.]